ncbi:transglycosylase domain-containing protein [Phytohabitans aurantiacus]|uniref:transglycosylase domain-containing protein n=1 Tax=Phytohabitans aurantiacus TaxID=3016789 RepID=UPI00248FCE55|nr:transglycosylase domain-containing protein [Phytohabitans aurantiacus]
MGRASVAGVAPVSGSPDAPQGPGGPEGPTGPGRRAARKAASGKGGKGGDPAAIKKAKRRKRVNLLVAAFAVMVIMAGGAVVGLTWFYDDVPEYRTEELQATSIVFENGNTMATLGEFNRTVVPAGEISPLVKHAVVAAEDKNFEDHEGIDVKGIMRAAWNNFTGGGKQGASTITQQYARHAADLTGINYNRKIREAVLARKLEQEYTKDEILGFYLNAIYLGRGCYGIEAAAQCYFGKSAVAKPGQKNALTAAEAAVLASVIKQPEPDPLTGHQGFDPQLNLPEAQARWEYTLNNMVEKKWLSAEERAAAQYPKFNKYDPKKCQVGCGLDKPTGNVVNYVRDELEAMGIPAAEWKKGGYRITTTINKKAQAAAEAAARRASKTSPMSKLPAHYQAALVAVNPKNGRVMAYYGGDNGTGTDFAGLNGDGTGPHAPGSTFKIYTLAAAMRAGIQVDSYWDLTKLKDGDRVINNAGRTNIPCGKSCTLEHSTVQSYNAPFYWISKELGPEKVVQAARDAGITLMKDTATGKVHDIAKADPKTVAPKYFDIQVGFGQYPVTVLDHANGVATLANRGNFVKAHFIEKVEKRNPATGKYDRVPGSGEKIKSVRKFDEAEIDNINSVLKQIPGSVGNGLAGGREAIGKTGTWELDDSGKGASGDAWMVGATHQVAAAVWVGTSGARRAIKEPGGGSMSGGGTPATIWELFMEQVHKDLDLERESFAARKNIGDPNSPYPNGVKPQDKPVDPCDLLPEGACGGRDDDGGGDDDDNDGPVQPRPDFSIRPRD